MLTIRDTGKEFELKGGFLKMIANKNYNVDLASLQDKKQMYEFAKEMHSDIRAPGNKSIRDKTPIKLLKSPGLMVSASGVYKTLFLPSNGKELCDRLKLLLQEKQVGNISDKFNDEFVILDKLLDCKSISKKYYAQILLKCNLLHE